MENEGGDTTLSTQVEGYGSLTDKERSDLFPDYAGKGREGRLELARETKSSKEGDDSSSR